MKAIIATGGKAPTDTEAFRAVELPTPRPTGRDILVKITASGFNPVDTKVFDGLSTEEERVLGWDACGVVVQAGSESRRFQTGQRVFYAGELKRPGSNAEFQLVDERLAANAPAILSDAEAACLPLTALTAWEGLFDRLGYTAAPWANTGTSLLVIGGAGGVGSMLVQLGAWSGFKVIATAGRPESAAWCRKLGAAEVIGRGDLEAELKAKGIDQVDAVFCTTHMAEHWEAMAKVLAPQGGVCLIDDPSGPVDITLFKAKAARICWEFMFARSMHHTPDMARQGVILAEVARLVDAGTLLATTGGEPLHGLTAESIQTAHLRQRGGSMVGKQVIMF